MNKSGRVGQGGVRFREQSLRCHSFRCVDFGSAPVFLSQPHWARDIKDQEIYAFDARR